MKTGQYSFYRGKRRFEVPDMTVMDKETAFAELVRDYENLWVAIIEKDGQELIAGSGDTPTKALQEARGKGFTNAVLFSVPSFSQAFIY
jgi:hypothetical protein